MRQEADLRCGPPLSFAQPFRLRNEKQLDVMEVESHNALIGVTKVQNVTQLVHHSSQSARIAAPEESSADNYKEISLISFIGIDESPVVAVVQKQIAIDRSHVVEPLLQLFQVLRPCVKASGADQSQSSATQSRIALHFWHWIFRKS